MYHQTRWTAEKINNYLSLVASLVYSCYKEIPAFWYTELDNERVSPMFDQLEAYNWQPLAYHSYWGKPDTNFMLRTTFTMPAEWQKNGLQTALFLPIGDAGSFVHPETLVYIDGKSIAGVDRYHHEIILPSAFCDGQTHEILMHGWTGNAHRDGEHGRLQLHPCSIVQIHQPARDLAALTRNILGSLDYLDDTVPAKHQLFNALDVAYKKFDTREPFDEANYASIENVLATLRDLLQSAGAPMDVTISATGHAHIDVAWLWTLGQTRNKARRTFHTVDLLMDQFPEYQFTQSQPQLYDYIRQDDPALFERIKTRIDEGRWEPTGGMWVEADCNLSGGEALARQFLLGRTFFKEHFGAEKDTPVLWLPDVFGYSWALPQMIKQAGLEFFMTIKISWNQYNKMPYDSFWWEGIDGTRVLTHFSATPNANGERANYNANVTPREIFKTWQLFQQKAEQRHLLMSFGFGDGGGGPTREMLENMQVMKSLPGMPQMKHDTAVNFFRRMEAESGEHLPTWNGELYFELHRGTYTTQARNKRGNRKSEFLLHDVELLSVIAGLLDVDFAYPHEELTRLWQLVCLNQFHDIIPGSSIHQVYVESLEQYDDILRSGLSLRQNAFNAIQAITGGDLLVINPTSFPYQGMVLWEHEIGQEQRIVDVQGNAIPTQTTDNGTLLAFNQLPAHSITALRFSDDEANQVELALSVSNTHLENALIRVEFNADGDITRISDKQHHREVMPENTLANQLQAFEDRPMNWDAWDIDIFYDDKMWLSEPASRVTVVESGPLRATLRIERRILNSPYTQHISLTADSPQITVTTDIDWRERHILLKVAFPVDILADKATYEIQWGNVERPTHRNTSWDWARFETVAHKWVDLSEGSYGVSLLNDCKYGHDIHRNTIRLSLLRAPTYPDETADLAQHTFTYALLPHTNDWRESTIPAAYHLNNPPIVFQPENSRKTEPETCTSFIRVDQKNVVIEAIKQAEDGNGIIVRLYESQRSRGQVRINTSFEIAGAHAVNLLEDPVDGVQLTVGAHEITFAIKPFEIITLRIIPAQ
ncbi:MAG: alpha-mannosidase [Aggregatilineales bacterium]